MDLLQDLRGVWPWKSEGVDGKILFFPNFSLVETHLTLVYIFIGILFVVLLKDSQTKMKKKQLIIGRNIDYHFQNYFTKKFSAIKHFQITSM